MRLPNLKNLFGRKNTQTSLKCRLVKSVTSPLDVEIKNKDIPDLYAIVRTIYLMGDTMKKRNKGLWNLSADIVSKIEPYLVNER